ncbi:MAG TPA: DNA polymerase Y family protein [Terriglobales bacterium]|jgi:protein ImuB|nr:DNA polymerase Y family protein [Terriglobales bacterium]
MFACLFIPDFPAEAIIRFEPELRGQPVVVLAGRPPLEKVVALNDKARQLGVEAGATKAQLEAWENLVLRMRSDLQETSAHAALLDGAQSFSPEVEETAADTVLLNLAGLEPLFGALPKIAHELAHRCSRMGLEANVAVAANPDAAVLAAHGFSGVMLIPQGREAERLGELPVDVLMGSFSSDAKEAARWLETFDRWGVRNLRALSALPEVPVAERLGQQGIRLLKLARGEASRNLRLFESVPVFQEEIELEHPIVLLEPLAFLLNRMLDQLCARLSARALAVQKLELKLGLVQKAEDCDPDQTSTFTRTFFTRALQLPVPMLDAKVFLKLLQLDLQSHPPGAPILRIHLTAMPARPRSTQSGLFLPIFPEPEKLELTLARIAGIVGQGRVGAVELLDTHREDAFQMQPFIPIPLESETSNKKKRDRPVQENDSVIRAEENARESAQEKMSAVIALRLFRPPLRAIANVKDGKPVRLKCLQHPELAGEIVWTAGPWRSSGDWSEQEGWSREEWDIALPAESEIILYRLVEDKLSRNWWLEGMYD